MSVPKVFRCIFWTHSQCACFFSAITSSFSAWTPHYVSNQCSFRLFSDFPAPPMNFPSVNRARYLSTSGTINMHAKGALVDGGKWENGGEKQSGRKVGEWKWMPSGHFWGAGCFDFPLTARHFISFHFPCTFYFLANSFFTLPRKNRKKSNTAFGTLATYRQGNRKSSETVFIQPTIHSP